jgi:hypothetical protein
MLFGRSFHCLRFSMCVDSPAVDAGVFLAMVVFLGNRPVFPNKRSGSLSGGKVLVAF